MNTQDPNFDPKLWQLARKRAAFQRHAASFLLVNGFLIAVWYFTSGGGRYFWPIWSILGWGIGLAFHYYEAYEGDRDSLAEKEYQRLKNQQ